MAVAMSAFTYGAVSVISSFIGRDLGMSTSEIAWISASSSLVCGAFLLFFGKVADLFGRKSMFLGSMFLFALFSLSAGFAQTSIGFLVLNGVMGLTCASAVPSAQGILSVTYERPSIRKKYAFACFSAGNPLGFVFGTVFSGIATQLFNWRASFWLIAIIYIVFTVIAVFTVPKDHTAKEVFNIDAIKRFDIVGTILTIGGIGMFSAALSLGEDAPRGWKTPYVLVFLILGIVLMIIFPFWEGLFRYPLVPMGIWKDRDFSWVMAILNLGYMAFPTGSFWIALYMQRIWRASALSVAVHLLPMAIAGIIVNVIAGLTLHRVSNKLLMGIATCAFVGAYLLLSLQPENDSYWPLIFPALVLSVIGVDLEFNVANMYVMSSLPSSSQSIAGSLFQTTTRLSSTLAYGVTAALFSGITNSQGASDQNELKPYRATFWFSVASAGLSALLVPFLTIKTQGHTSSIKSGQDETKTEVVGRSERASTASVPLGD